jgi:large subunit ribosomal protein L1
MGSKKPVNMTSSPDEIKIVEAEDQEKKKAQKEKKVEAEKAEPAEAKKPSVKKPKKTRSKKYQAVRSKIDRTKAHDPFAGIELVKKLSYTKFPGTITAHLTVKEQGLSKELALPHSTGKTRTIEIASEETIKKIEGGNIDFDVLLATPQMMSKLTKYAPILGPKGLMPNPKNGTLTPNPEQRQKELAGGTMNVRTEKKAPLIHVAIGKTDMETEKLVENLQTLIKAFQQKLTKVVIAATMSPGVKISIEKAE